MRQSLIWPVLSPPASNFPSGEKATCQPLEGETSSRIGSGKPSEVRYTWTLSPPPAVAACQVGDQDQYVYHPARLQVRQACVEVSGEVLAEIREVSSWLTEREQAASIVNLYGK